MATKRVLVIQTAFLGDLLLSVPLLKHLKSQFPGSEISLVCRQGVGSVLKDLKVVDAIYEVKKKDRRSYRDAQRKLSSLEFDLLLSPHESFTSALFASRIHAKVKIGFQKWWNSFFFTETVAKDPALPEALRQLSLLRNHDPQMNERLFEFQKAELEWGKSSRPFLSPIPEWASPRVSPSVNFEEIRKKRDLPNRYVCLFPGSVWATKQWTETGFTETAQQLSRKGSSVLIMGGPGEEELCERVASGTPGARSLAGKTSLSETLAILERADVVVTNDSAGQHLAALVQAPTVSIFGPTVLEFGYRAWNSKAIVVERKDLRCRPCGKHGHHQCPLGTHECMKSVEATEVLAAVEKICPSSPEKG